MENLLIYSENAKSFITDAITAYKRNDSFQNSFDSYTLFCQGLQMVAYGHFLSLANTNKFYKLLMCISNNWKFLLQQYHKSNEKYCIPASKEDGLLCSLVCNRFDIAKEIALLSSKKLILPEYDDEFYKALFLQKYILEGNDTKEKRKNLECICKKIEKYLGTLTPFLEFYYALIYEEYETISTTFNSWSESAAEEIENRAESPGAPYSLGITRYIWLEGLAIHRICMAKGFNLDTQYKFIPLLLTKLPTIQFDDTYCILGKSKIPYNLIE